MFRRAITLTITFVAASAYNVCAAPQDRSADQPRPLTAAIAHASVDADGPVTLWSLSQTPKRPTALPVLYGTYAALQVMDMVSTHKALAAGAHEANPLMGPGNGAASMALKAASGVATFLVVEKTWKKHRVGAIMLMAVMNGATAAVVVHNNHNAARR